jgi:hypothetical protein
VVGVERVEVGVGRLHVDANASRNPMRSKRGSTPGCRRDRAAVLLGMLRSSQKVIGLTGSDIAAHGSCFSSRQRFT